MPAGSGDDKDLSYLCGNEPKTNKRSIYGNNPTKQNSPPAAKGAGRHLPEADPVHARRAGVRQRRAHQPRPQRGTRLPQHLPPRTCRGNPEQHQRQCQVRALRTGHPRTPPAAHHPRTEVLPG